MNKMRMMQPFDQAIRIFIGAHDGLAAIPGKEAGFRQSFAKSLDYALALKCGK